MTAELPLDELMKQLVPDIIEILACVAERTRIRGQRYHWLGAYWTYVDIPATSDDAARAVRLASSDEILAEVARRRALASTGETR